jgi:hypothetical protein
MACGAPFRQVPACLGDEVIEIGTADPIALDQQVEDGIFQKLAEPGLSLGSEHGCLPFRLSLRLDSGRRVGRSWDRNAAFSRRGRSV